MAVEHQLNLPVLPWLQAAHAPPSKETLIKDCVEFQSAAAALNSHTGLTPVYQRSSTSDKQSCSRYKHHYSHLTAELLRLWSQKTNTTAFRLWFSHFAGWTGFTRNQIDCFRLSNQQKQWLTLSPLMPRKPRVPWNINNRDVDYRWTQVSFYIKCYF